MDIFSPNAAGSLLHKYYDGHQWQPSASEWQNLTSDGKFGDDSALSITSWSADRLDIFGISGSRLIHKFYDGTLSGIYLSSLVS